MKHRARRVLRGTSASCDTKDLCSTDRYWSGRWDIGWWSAGFRIVIRRVRREI